MKIYTRTGDNLTTSAISKRVYKDDAIIECIGTVDELQASLMVSSNLINNEDVKYVLIGIVRELFDLSKDILKFLDGKSITQEKVLRIENLIDSYNEKLQPINDFLLPGKNLISSQLHLSRTIARRLERRLVSYGRQEDINHHLFKYINRLSDLLFVLARYME